MAVANFTRLRLMELPILTLTPVRLAALAAAAAVGSTCGENITPPDNGDGDVVPASVSITGGAEVNIAGTLQLSATAKDASGVTITVVIMWASSDSAIATVDNTGKVTGVARGTVTIEASATGAAGAVTDTHDVTVRIASVAVSPATVTITSLGDTARLTAEAKDELGGTVPGVTFTFASSDTTVATVDDQGNVVAVGNGTGTVTVSGDTRSAEASITVAQQAARVSVTPAAVTMDALELDTALAATV
ncbi:MAG: Ig domain-containing protein, partial [Gemmatimonadales bacterium]